MRRAAERDSGPGVPEALPTTLALVRDRLGTESLDRLWIFPPITKGRRESGLVAVSCFDEDDLRRLFTAAYTAERTGRGLQVEPALTEEGRAPSDRFPRMMAGVVRRCAVELGDPDEIVVAGDASVLAELMEMLEARIDPGVAVKVLSHIPSFVRLFGRYLREQGLPVTQQREAVAEVVFGSDGHPSVDEIERQLRQRGERIGKATIYRTLDLLVRSKLVAEHDFGEGFKRYEHRLSRQPVHEHLICLECGTVTEFQSTEVLRLEEQVARQHGFRPTRHRLEIYGLCVECQKAGVELDNDGLTCPIDTV